MVKQKISKSLHEAVRSGNIKTVEALLTKGADINSKSSENDKSTLHIAVEINNIEMVEFLLSEGANVDLKDSGGRSALYYALARGRLEIADALIKAGSNVNSQDEDGYTALMIVQLNEDHKCTIDDLELTKELLTRGADVNIKASNGFTAIMFAALMDHSEVFKCLIEARADVNYRSNEGAVALHIAVQRNNMEMVKDLISRNADINIKNLNGLTALHIAINSNNLDVADYLIDIGIDVNCTETGQGLTALHLIAQNKSNNVSLVGKILSRSDCKIDIKDFSGMTALGYALILGNLEVADLLIAAGGDVNSQENKGFTALNSICNPKNRKYITDGVQLSKELLKRGVDPKLPNSMGQTALHMALCNKDLNMMKYLIDAGAININYQDTFGLTVLQYAAGHNDVETVKYLLSRNADANIRHKEGETALHVAIKTEKFEIAQLLIDAGVDVNIQENRLGLTALHMLASSTTDKNTWLVQKLLSRGAKVDIKDSQGRTALNYALLRGAFKMADLLIKAGGDINCQDSNGFTTLSIICDKKNRKNITDGVQMAKELMRRGADVNVRSSCGMNALHSALISREGKLARFFIDSGADINCRDKDAYTALHLAAMSGDVSIVRLLLSRGADINAKNNEGNTALHESVIYKQFEMVKELLSRNPDVSVRNNLGNTALETAIIKSDGRLLKEHFVATEENTNFHDATFSKRHMNAIRKTPQFQHLKSLGDDANLKDFESPNPIHSIVSYKKSDLNKKVIKKLLKKGGKPRAENGASGVALLNLEYLKNDSIFMLFFGNGVHK